MLLKTLVERNSAHCYDIPVSSLRWGSNPQSLDSKSNALTIALRRSMHKKSRLLPNQTLITLLTMMPLLWTKTCCFCNKIDANRDCNPFRHALTCPNLKEIVQYFCQTLGKVQSLKDYTAKSLLLGKENGKGYSFDDDHIIMLITFYCVWKKRNWTSHSSVDLKRKILEIFHYEYAHYSN
eukprot:Awhi_evm1s15116